MGNLFENEEIRYGNGYPSLVRFCAGNSRKPLVVFFPGWCHLGRISYGFPECKEEHFLAHWIVKRGYPFLATSYPINHPVYSNIYPEFTLTDWGEMTSQIVEEIISENNLIKEVIAIHWSASGQVIRSFNLACIAKGIKIRFGLGLEASPAMQVPYDRIKGLQKTDNNMVSLKKSHYPLFWQELEEQNSINGEVILNKKQFNEYFLGDVPIAVTGTDEFFERGKFINDAIRGLEDKSFFSFSEYPFVAVVSGNSHLSPYHPIVDKTTWSFLNTRKVYHDFVVNSQKNGSVLSQQRLKDLVMYTNSLSSRLTRVVSGNHFLFVGKMGARKVANTLEKFDSKIEDINKEIIGILYE
jgi:hypothetical protein